MLCLVAQVPGSEPSVGAWGGADEHAAQEAAGRDSGASHAVLTPVTNSALADDQAAVVGCPRAAEHLDGDALQGVTIDDLDAGVVGRAEARLCSNRRLLAIGYPKTAAFEAVEGLALFQFEGAADRGQVASINEGDDLRAGLLGAVFRIGDPLRPLAEDGDGLVTGLVAVRSLDDAREVVALVDPMARIQPLAAVGAGLVIAHGAPGGRLVFWALRALVPVAALVPLAAVLYVIANRTDWIGVVPVAVTHPALPGGRHIEVSMGLPWSPGAG